MYGTVEYKLNRDSAVNNIKVEQMSVQERIFMSLLESGDQRIRDLEERIKKLDSSNKLLIENQSLKQELAHYKATNKMLMKKIEELNK